MCSRHASLGRRVRICLRPHDFVHQRKRELSQIFITNDRPAVSIPPARIDNPLKYPDQFAPTLERDVISCGTFHSGASEFGRDFVCARLRRAFELAKDHQAVIVALYFGFGMSIHRNETKTAEHALSAKCLARNSSLLKPFCNVSTIVRFVQKRGNRSTTSGFGSRFHGDDREDRTDRFPLSSCSNLSSRLENFRLRREQKSHFGERRLNRRAITKCTVAAGMSEFGAVVSSDAPEHDRDSKSHFVKRWRCSDWKFLVIKRALY